MLRDDAQIKMNESFGGRQLQYIANYSDIVFTYIKSQNNFISFD